MNRNVPKARLNTSFKNKHYKNESVNHHHEVYNCRQHVVPTHGRSTVSVGDGQTLHLSTYTHTGNDCDISVMGVRSLLVLYRVNSVTQVLWWKLDGRLDNPLHFE